MIRKTELLYGIYTSIVLIAYFLLMSLFGLEKIFGLRLFNFAIVICGIYVALKSYFKNVERPTYFDGLFTGFKTGIIAVVLFVIFLALYVKRVDPDFISVLRESKMWGDNIDLKEAAGAILIEGLSSVFIISFGWMQHFKQYLPEQK